MSLPVGVSYIYDKRNISPVERAERIYDMLKMLTDVTIELTIVLVWSGDLPELYSAKDWLERYETIKVVDDNQEGQLYNSDV